MKLINSIAKRFGFVSGNEVERQATALAQNILKFNHQKRAFSAASLDRLTADWLAGNTSGDTELRNGFKTMRNRARDLERNEDYMRRYLALQENNVLGSCGVDLQMKCLRNGKPDKEASDAIEEAWADWGRKENCSVTRRMTWRQVEGLTLRSARRD